MLNPAHLFETALTGPLGLFGAPPPPPLSSPPLFERLVFESPWVVVAILGVAAIAAVVVGNMRGDVRKGALVGLPLALLAGGVYLASVMITTPRETIAARTRALTASVANADVPGVEAMLDSEALLFVFDDDRGEPVSRILSRVENELGNVYAIESHTIPDLQVKLRTDQIALSQVRVIVTPELTRVPTPTWVRLEWIKRTAESDWKVRQIDVLQVAGMTRGRR